MDGLSQLKEWRAIEPAQLALKAPVVDKDADAEALLWEVYVNDAEMNTEYLHFLRIKVFTQRGVESEGKIDLPYFPGTKIQDVAGRTVKPDGTVVELKKDAIYDREIFKFGKLKVKAKSFAMPAVEPGAIIEYRWKEVYLNQMANNVPLQLQRSIPVQQVRYYIKPYPYATYPMKTVSFRVSKDVGFVKDKNGYYRIDLPNMPAYREEPNSPPEDNLRSWMLIYYGPDIKQTPQQYWQDIGKRFNDVIKSKMKPNDEVRLAAASAVGDSSTPEQKLERLLAFCRAKIKNVNDDASGITSEQRKAMKDNNTPADTLKHGYGDRDDIAMLFAAMATAAGLDAHVALMSDRSRFFFTPDLMNTYFLRTMGIAVRLGDKWQFYDPSNADLPAGMINWRKEGVYALVIDPKEAAFVKTPESAPEKSLEHAVAKLRLLEDGTIEGDVIVEYTGHQAAVLREDIDDKGSAEREKRVIDQIKSRLPSAEVSEVKVTFPDDPAKPAGYSCKVRVPGYAERTGKRLFLQPSFFQRGVKPRFTGATRQSDIYFEYGYKEWAEVSIELPPGYALEDAEAPASFPMADIGRYDVKLSLTKDRKMLIYERKFKFGVMMIPKQFYSDIKKLFDILHQQDAHTVTLRQQDQAVQK